MYLLRSGFFCWTVQIGGVVTVDLLELHQTDNLKIVPVVPNIHQFRMIEVSVQQKECIVLPRSVPQSCLWLLEAVPLTSLLVDFSVVHGDSNQSYLISWKFLDLFIDTSVSSVIPSFTSLQINPRARRVEVVGCVALLCRLSPGSLDRLITCGFRKIIR